MIKYSKLVLDFLHKCNDKKFKNPYQNIIVFTSIPLGLTNGNGKTLSMTEIAYILKQHGFKIISNFHIDFCDGYYSIKNLPEIMSKENNIVILCDEISKIINAYSGLYGKEIKQIFKTIFNSSIQLRKTKTFLFVTAQNYNMIPKFMRRLSQNIFEVIKIHYDNTICQIQDNKECPYKNHFYFLEEMTESKLNITLTADLPQINKNGELEIIKNYFYNCYNSDEVIE